MCRVYVSMCVCMVCVCVAMHAGMSVTERYNRPATALSRRGTTPDICCVGGGGQKLPWPAPAVCDTLCKTEEPRPVCERHAHTYTSSTHSYTQVHESRHMYSRVHSSTQAVRERERERESPTRPWSSGPYLRSILVPLIRAHTHKQCARHGSVLRSGTR